MSNSKKKTVLLRTISLIMCFVLTASLFVTAFAANAESNDSAEPQVEVSEVAENTEDAQKSVQQPDDAAAQQTDDAAQDGDVAAKAEKSYKSFLLTGGITIGLMILFYVLIEVKTHKSKGKPVKKK